MKYTRQRRYEQRQDALGMVKVRVIVPSADKPVILETARQLRQSNRQSKRGDL